MPLYLAEKWKAPFFPVNASTEATEQYRFHIEEIASAAWRIDVDSVEMEGTNKTEAEHALNAAIEKEANEWLGDLEHDLGLLRQYKLESGEQSKAKKTKGTRGRRRPSAEEQKIREALEADWIQAKP